MMKLGTAGKNVAKVMGCIAVSFLVGQTGMIAAEKTECDLEAGKELYKYKTDPTPYKVKVKTGKMPWNTRTSVVKQNPITGKISDYNGNKKPVNKKAIKLY